MLKYPIKTAAVIVSVSCVLVSCGGNSDSVNTGNAAAKFTIDNCGLELEFKDVAQRAVTTEQAATDTLLALEVEKQVVGTANLKTAVLPEYKDKYEAIEKIAEKVPTAEQVRAVDPDLVYSPFESVFAADKIGTREELKKLGVNAYYSNVECRDYGPNVGQDAFDLIAKDITDLGTIFGAEERAKKLVEEQENIVSEAKKVEVKNKDIKSVVYLYSVYKGAPYVAGATGVGQSISDIVGVENAFGDVRELWPEVAWEAIAERNPDVIVLADLKERGAPGDSYEDKIEAMKKDPAMSKLDAVKNERFIIVPGVELDANVRSAHALKLIADGLAEQ